MIFIHGKREIRIKKYDDYHIKCANCDSYGQRFSVYQKYFHVFWIPTFPLGKKTIQSVCLNCNDTFNEEQKNYYLSITRRPIYLYTGLILFVGLIIAFVIGYVITQKQRIEHVANPKINDVYLNRENENDSKIYYFSKIKNIDVDTVELIHGHLQYNRFISAMNDSDYFVNDEIYKVLKSDLKNFLEKGLIKAVKRDYDKSSRFMIEKSRPPVIPFLPCFEYPNQEINK